ncbi:hypothetical protein [Sphingobacterium sp. CZ-2]|uniref:hypothetical protein n=1 Tax=Sphingobacterium sp. CZ-2 TaxID=2557994 RepID=UPI00106F0F01|nr:hypothetical protein [Sphingobacterium sp. CZ-2]QBR13572.1 hypothetical protein E3D81_15860 [Sphingobacterium sp. CZ-2]
MEHKIPAQHEGKKMDIVESVDFQNETTAKEFFSEAKARLLSINKWFQVAELPASSFELLDASGQHSNEEPQEGDFIKIEIPGPGLKSTGGYDYVQIEQISVTSGIDQDLITLTVRPSSQPNVEDDHETKHFFKNLATSTFQVRRVGNTVTANYYGRNELMNLRLDSFMDRIRNLFVALGAKLGASSVQWEALVKGIIKT